MIGLTVVSFGTSAPELVTGLVAAARGEPGIVVGNVVTEVSAAVERDALVVVGMARNPFVKKARKALTAAGIEFTYLEYGSYTKQWKPRLAIKLWSGWPTFPQVYVRGSLIGGNQELQAALADGSLASRLAA